MRDKLLNFTLVVLCFSSLTIVALLIKREFASNPERPEQIKMEPKWRILAKGGIDEGSESAAVTLAVFYDFQCPFCKALWPSLITLRQKYPKTVRVIYHHFPLEVIHPFARQAAFAAECANSKGRFTEMETALFKNQNRIGVVDWSWFGKTAGLSDPKWLAECVRDSVFVPRVDADVALGQQVGVNGTPTVFVNMWKIPGTPSFAIIDSLINEELHGGKD
jgi:protein-disulfide isomerase